MNRLDVVQVVASLALLAQNLSCWYALAWALRLKLANAAVINLLIAFSLATPLCTVLAWVIHMWPRSARLYAPYLWINGVLLSIGIGYNFMAAPHDEGYTLQLTILIISAFCWCYVLGAYICVKNSRCVSGVQYDVNSLNGGSSNGRNASIAPQGRLRNQSTQTDVLPYFYLAHPQHTATAPLYVPDGRGHEGAYEGQASIYEEVNPQPSHRLIYPKVMP